MNRRRILQLAAPAVALAALAACGAPVAQPGRPVARGGGSGVLEVARTNNLTSFVRAVETAGLTDRLSGDGPYTLFVPDDSAFRAARISPTGNRDELRRIIAYHIVPGQVGSSFMTGMNMNHLTSTGNTLNVDGRGAGIRVNQANVTRRDLLAANGVIHVVDRVLRPA
jgi:uncharacterized surface protein with fasciclin (FAS1) repeats